MNPFPIVPPGFIADGAPATLAEAIAELRIALEDSQDAWRAGVAARDSGHYNQWAGRARRCGIDEVVVNGVLRDNVATGWLTWAEQAHLWLAAIAADLPDIEPMTLGESTKWLLECERQGCPRHVSTTVSAYLARDKSH